MRFITILSALAFAPVALAAPPAHAPAHGYHHKRCKADRIEDRVDPRNSIFGGAQYYARQTERVADSVEEPDRTWMALAAYNVGFNHLKDARMIVEWQGGDPDTWVDISKALPLLAQRKWYTKVPFGYARGWEPVLYVNNIRRYYNILKWLTANEEPEIPEDSDAPEEVVSEPETVEETREITET